MGANAAARGGTLAWALRERRPEALSKNNRRRFSAGSWRAPSSRRKRRSTQAKQHAAAPNRTKSPAQQKTPTATGVTLIDATQCEMMQTKQVPPQGLEQLPFSSWNRDISDQGVVGGDITHFVEAQLYMRIVKSRIGFYLVGALTTSILSAVA